MTERFFQVCLAVFFLFFLGNFGRGAGPIDAASQQIVSDSVGALKRIVDKKTLNRFYDPVEIRAEILTELLGKQASSLRLYSFSDGTFHQVPFQFDEWTPDGYMVCDVGPDANADLGNGILDPQDMVI